MRWASERSTPACQSSGSSPAADAIELIGSSTASWAISKLVFMMGPSLTQWLTAAAAGR